MIGASVRVVAAVVFVTVSFGAVVAGTQAPAADCVRWDECRDRALEARASNQYERFHDLAWRAVQAGPPNDPALMYLLARAQAVSGRRRDALIMLRRLADMGIPTDAAAEEDFRRTRELPGWTQIASRFETLRNGRGAAGAPPPAESAASSSPVAPSRPATPVAAAPPVAAPPRADEAPPAPPPPAPVAAAPRPAVPAAAPAVPEPVISPMPAAEVVRFATESFAPAGIAYDEVSRRFLFGDTLGRRLFVIGEGSSRTVDLVRGDAAGFHDVTAIEIDARRGDLWVTSTAADESAASVHRLQLISGRALATFVASPAGATVALRDIAVTPNGAILLLDSSGRRVLRLPQGAKSLETVLTLDVAQPASLATSNSDRAAYIAHAGGIIRVDLQQRTARELSVAAGVSVAGFERIRWHRNSLVGVQRLADGQRALIVVQLDRAGTSAAASRVIDPALDREARSPLLTIVGDDVYYSVIDGANPASAASTVDVLVRRIRLP
jgi:hypothetical protein